MATRPRTKQEEHPKGIGDKARRQYEHIKHEAEESGRDGDRAEEVAARTVMTHHEQEHHGKGEKPYPTGGNHRCNSRTS